MIYVGQAGYNPNDACIIDPALAVLSGAEHTPHINRENPEQGYAELLPSSRLQYLRWLAAGKCDPFTDPANVFLYLRGLERRLLIDRPDPREERLILAEISRLQSIYSKFLSLDAFFTEIGQAMVTVGELRGDVGLCYEPDLGAPQGVMPTKLAITLARAAAEKRPLSFELAVAGLAALGQEVAPGVLFVPHPDRWPDFLRVLSTRYEKAFPDGFLLQDAGGPRFRVEHQSTSGLKADLMAASGAEALPDPAGLSWTGLIDIAAEVTETISKPKRSILTLTPKRPPARREEKQSEAALAIVPAKLSLLKSPGSGKDPRRWLAGLPNPIAEVKYFELFLRITGTQATIVSRKEDLSLAEQLASFGWGMEPDPVDREDPMGHHDDVCLVAGPECLHPKSDAFWAATAAAALTADACAAGGAATAEFSDAWAELARAEYGLPRGEALRLRAKLQLFAKAPTDEASAERLAAGVSIDRREPIARLAASVAAGTPPVTVGRFEALEKLYDRLAVSRRGLYSIVHGISGEVSPPAEKPVIVVRETPSPARSIPRPPKEKKKVKLDRKRIKVALDETKIVSKVLEDVFVVPETVDPPKAAVRGQFQGLDVAHGKIVEQLEGRPSCPKAEFDRIAKQLGLMPDGAMETLNDWSLEHFENVLIEGDDPLLVDVSLIEKAKELPDVA